MVVAYILPLQRAWARARDMLFHRIGLEGWAVLGFAAFLASLVDSGTLNSWRTRWGVDMDPFELTDVSVMGIPVAWFNEQWFALAVPLIAIGLVLLVAMLWIGSRGKFLFLESVLSQQPAIVEPWTRLGRLGDSLFLWRIAFWLAAFVALAVAAAPLVVFDGDNPLSWLLLAMSIGAGVCISLFCALVLLMLESFVVPIMYQRRLRCIEAWGVFLPLLRRHTLEFVLFAVFVLLVSVLLIVTGLVVGVLACCVILPILMLLAIPYVGSVLLLPITVTYRLFSVEFLAQFGPEFHVTATQVSNAAALPTATEPPDTTRP